MSIKLTKWDPAWKSQNKPCPTRTPGGHLLTVLTWSSLTVCSVLSHSKTTSPMSYKNTDPIRLGSLPMALVHLIYLLGPYVLGTVMWAHMSFEN